MEKILNSPVDFVKEMLEGIYVAHPKNLTFVNNDIHCLIKKTEGERNKKVSLITGGGSGHLPLFLGFVGEGLLDACAVGDVFQSPSARQIYEITKVVNNGVGVLYIYGNYNGDIMNFEMASEMLEMDNIETKHVLGNDDVASSDKGEEHKRRGVAGIFFVYKCAGAKADEGAKLEEVYRIAQKATENTRTMGVALSACIVPEIGKPSFHIKDDEMELGMGIHGEPGISRTKLKTSDEIVEEILNKIVGDLPYSKNDEVAVLINSLGGTPKEELYIMYRKAQEILTNLGIKIFHVYIGEFATSMEMKGASISLLKLDSELKGLLAKKAHTPFFMQGQL